MGEARPKVLQIFAKIFCDFWGIFNGVLQRGFMAFYKGGVTPTPNVHLCSEGRFWWVRMWVRGMD